MAEHVQRHTALVDVTESAGGAFSIMKGLVNFFADKVPNVTSSKAMTSMEIMMVTSYSRESYLVFSILLSYYHNIYGKLVDDMGNSYSMR